MSIFKLFQPVKTVAEAVDRVIDHFNDKYELELKVVEGGFKLRINDLKPKPRPPLLEEKP